MYYNYATQYSRGIINWCSVWGVVSGNGQATFLGAIGLAIGIGIQNIPEGAALSMPIRAAGASRLKSFNYGQASAIVEPIFATIGAAAILVVNPFTLCISLCRWCDDLCRR